MSTQDGNPYASRDEICEWLPSQDFLAPEQSFFVTHKQISSLGPGLAHRDPVLVVASNSVRKLYTVHFPGQEAQVAGFVFLLISYTALFLFEYPVRRPMSIAAVLMTKISVLQRVRRPTRYACRTG